MNIKKDDKEIINKIIQLFKPYKWKIILVITCIIISSALSLITPFINQKLIDEGLVMKNFNIITKYSIYTLMLIIIIQCLGIVETKYRSYIENILSYNLEKEAFKHTLKLKMDFFCSTNYAEIMSNLRTDINNISQIANQSTFYIVTSIFRIMVGIVGLIVIDWRLSILVMVVTPVRYFLVKYLAKKKKNIFEEMIENYEKYYRWYGDTIGGVKEIKIWGLESLKTGELIKQQRNIIRQNIKMAYLSKVNEISETVFTQIITTLIYIIGGYMIIGEMFTIGKLVAFITYSAYVTAPIFAIMNIGYSFASVIPSAKRYFNFMNMDNEISANNAKLERIEKNNVLGNIEFRNVKFSYENSQSVLRNINFKIEAGEKVAIIGRNGSGKSTIINLILRFLTPSSGEILLDGKDINYIKLRDYRRLISIVSQDIYLFNDTIRKNIMLNFRRTDEDMYLATKKTGAYNFIEEMPKKYETVVGEKGSKLSGGERQKVAMARAFMRDSKILILDEATANYDIESECKVNNVIQESYKDKTVIIITHKPDILLKVDKIIVINDGQVEAVGTHLELYKINNFYREMITKSLKATI